MLVLALLVSSLAAHGSNTPTELDNCKKVALETTLGKIVIALYNDTPAHTANFVKLAGEGHYDGLLFHRVIKEFMVQGGDPSSREAKAGAQLGSGDMGYTIEAEFVYPQHFHKRGALAAARTSDQVNPERRSSGSQFYIVTGKVYTPAELTAMQSQLGNQAKQGIFTKLVHERIDSIRSLQQQGNTTALDELQNELIALTEAEYAKNPFTFTPEQIEAYSTVGGTPFLDNQYTVYGEVVEGMDVVAAIEQVATGAGDRPVEDVRIVKATVLQ